VVGRDSPHEEVVPEWVGFLGRGIVARHHFIVALAPGGRMAGLVALGAVRLVVERVIELRGL